ncbi:MAG: type II secretion system F family protein [Gammaproteobacteria bacterium]
MASKANVRITTFQWEGRDRQGHRVRGREPSVAEALLRNQLRGQGITVTRIRRERFKSARGRRIRPRDIANFTRQLATLTGAGVPIVQSLDIIGTSDNNPRMQNLVGRMKADVESGTALSKALSEYPKYFDTLFVNLVQAGEHSGQLEQLLEKIATYKEKMEYIKSKIKKAMFYPASVIAVAVLVMIVMLIWVIPEFQKLFNGFGASLPAYTRMVIDLSESVRNYAPVYIVVIAAIVSAITWFYRRSAAFRLRVDQAILRIPIIGAILKKAIIARFARSLATMYGAGVPMVEGLDIIAGTAGNRVYEIGIHRIRDQVATGRSLQETMKQTDLFPNAVVQMIAIGEQSGKIQDMANKVAVIYENEVDNAVETLSTLLEPIIIVVLGIIVGSLVVAMYLPIFKLGSVV